MLLNDDEQAARLRRLRWCGIDASTWQRTGKQYRWNYDVVELGWKYHWNDVQAAIALAQLARLPSLNERRWNIAARYSRELADIVECPAPHDCHTWHLYPIRVDTDRRDALLSHLEVSGISAGVHYKPATMHPLFQGERTPPVTAAEWPRLVSLPIYPDLSNEEQAEVIAAVRSFFGRAPAREAESEVPA